MPIKGDIVLGKELDRKPFGGKFIYAVCQCGSERYIHITGNATADRLCRDCTIKKSKKFIPGFYGHPSIYRAS